MRITEKNMPILRMLKIKKPFFKPGEMPNYRNFPLEPSRILTGDETLEERNRIGIILYMYGVHWDHYSQLFGKSIDIASKPFMEAAENNADKILNNETMKELLKTMVSGTLILHDTSISYRILKKDDKLVDMTLLVFKGGHLAFVNEGKQFFLSNRSKRILEEIHGDEEGLKKFFIQQVLLFLLFKRYAEVEVVDAKPFKKVRIPDNENETLMVDSNLPTKYYDCSWFRTIVRKEGFMVRGHFRLQPCKNQDGEWDHKLIYIEPYQKHGYTRTARKVTKQRKEE